MNFYWQIALFTFSLMVVLGIFCLKFFPKIGLVDRPEKYGMTRAAIPYSGGVAMYLVFLIGVLIFVPIDKEVLALLVGSGVIVLVGFLDDRFGLSPLVRIFFQFVAGLILVVGGVGILSIHLPFFGNLAFVPLLSAAFTILWVMTIVNAMNFLDGVSGLNSGVSAIASLTLFFLSIHPGLHENPASQTGLASLALILSMVAFGFLLFDFPKARMLMGDAGSTFLGFVLATLAIFSGGKVATAFLVLGVPILDMMWVVFRRTFVEKKKFWQGDLKHMHHRFLNLGLSDRKVLAFYYFVTAVFGLLAVSFVDTEQKFFVLIALVILVVILAGALIRSARRRI